jgi:hypothetical protein
MAKRFTIPRGVSPSLAGAITNLLQAERLWIVSGRKHGEGSPEEKAAWAVIRKAEGFVCRTRCRTLADMGAKLRLDAYVGGVGYGPLSSLYASVLRDAQASSAKGRAA